MTVWGWLYLAATSTVLLCGMVLRSPLAVATETPSDTGATVRRSPERPWLTREAAAQVVRDDGGLGPLFDGLTLGGPPPSPALRARLAAFEAANDVHLEVEIGEGVVVAVRFDVTFSGCCGYEGADVFALALHRPHTGISPDLRHDRGALRRRCGERHGIQPGSFDACRIQLVTRLSSKGSSSRRSR